MSIITLMRGVSGSGKSTRAKELKINDIVSTDDFFTINGCYNFDYSRIGEAHEYTRSKVDALMKTGVDVIVDNTNIRWWELMPYLEMAKKYEYKVDIVKVGSLAPEHLELYFERNSHGVPLEIIQRQADNFEKLMNPEVAYELELMRQKLASLLKDGF